MDFTPLDTFRFPDNTCIQQAQPKLKGRVTVDSPSLEVMTDLAQVKAATIHPTTRLTEAEQAMIQQGVRSLFVVSAFPCVDGLVTASDLAGEKPMRLTSQQGSKHKDLCVADVMTPLSELNSLDYEQLKTSTVGNVIATLHKTGRSHLLVVQGATAQGPARIRGVISLTQVERQLGQALLDLVTLAAT